MKTRNLLLICILWFYTYSFGAEAPWFDGAYLYIRIPSNINTKKYGYKIVTKYVNGVSYPSGCNYTYIDTPGQILKCGIRRFRNEYEDTLVDVQFIVLNFRGGEFVQHQARIKITSDSMFYAVPELPSEEELNAVLKVKEDIYQLQKRETDSLERIKNKAFRKEHRGEDFTRFMTNWKSYFIYANFYQGNRPYGEISFSNARYNEVVKMSTLFSRYKEHVPGFIRGPVYGAEFNFLWRKNDFILGPKLGFQITTRFVNLGLSGVYYTDFTHGLFCIKPRIGMNPGIPWVNFSYEYAIRCGYNYFGNRINSHQFSMYLLIPLRLKESDAFL